MHHKVRQQAGPSYLQSATELRHSIVPGSNAIAAGANTTHIPKPIVFASGDPAGRDRIQQTPSPREYQRQKERCYANQLERRVGKIRPDHAGPVMRGPSRYVLSNRIERGIRGGIAGQRQQQQSCSQPVWTIPRISFRRRLRVGVETSLRVFIGEPSWLRCARTHSPQSAKPLHTGRSKLSPRTTRASSIIPVAPT